MYSSYSVGTVIVSVIFPLLAAIAVALRFRSRRVKHFPLGWDDYTILLALIITIGAAMMCIYGAVDGGIGDNPLRESQDEAVRFFKIIFSMIILLLAALTMIKISILLLYKRIFTTLRFKIVANVTMVIVVGWFLAFFIGIFFSCRPLSNFWNNRAVGFAYGFPTFLLMLAILDLVVDLFTLCLPLPVIRRLNMRTKRRIQLIGIFWLGLFCVVSATVRLYYVWAFSSIPSAADPAFPRIINNNFIWSMIEPCTSIIAACLPTLGSPISQWRGPESIVKKVRSMFSLHSLTSLKGSSPSGGSAPGNGNNKGDRGNAGTSIEAKRAWQRLQESNQTHPPVVSVPPRAYEMNDLEHGPGIKVEKNFTATMSR